MATRLEYPTSSAGLYSEPALKADSPNGDRTLVLVYNHASVSGSRLEIVVKDKVQPIRVGLFYLSYPEGMLARWSVIEQVASVTWNLPVETDYSLSWVTGQWGACGSCTQPRCCRVRRCWKPGADPPATKAIRGCDRAK
ncbi:MAG: glycoside hydrolase family 36 N-terminal domain-containing protein [Janthinobacterium lividum]